MTEDRHAWIERLVDGEPLDWPALERAMGADSPALARMRRMAVLCAALTAGQSPRTSGSAPCLFRWGHLDVREAIGRGSSGDVFRAFDTVLERDVALKLIGSESLQARAFIAEARRLAQVRHPNVLAVHGAAVHDGRAGLWSERVAGRSLADWIKDEGPRSSAQMLGTGQALASALEAVHAAGLVHGDIKPANVMREDGTGRIVLMDFGSAAGHAEAGRHGLLGSPASMAPEQLRGGPIGPSSDMYGLGVVLFHLVTGRYPVEASGVGELLAAHATDASSRAVRRCDRLPYALRTLLRELLDADSSARPDAAAVRMRLRRIATAPVRRRRRAGWIAAVTALAAGLAATAWQARIADRQSVQATRTKDFIVSLFDDFRLFEHPDGAELTVREMIAAAAPRLETELAGAPASQAEIRAQFGVALSDLGALPQARPLLARSAGQLRAIAPDSGQLVRTLSALAIVELHRGELASARRAIDEALEILDRWPEARRQQALEHRVHLRSSEFGVLSQQGRLAEALDVARRVRDDRAALFGENHPDIAGDWNNLGRVYLQLDRFVEAEQAYRQSMTILGAATSEEDPRFVWLRAGLGAALMNAGHYAPAEAEFDRALDLAERRLGPAHFMTANILRQQGQLAMLTEDYGRADDLFARAIAIETDQQGGDRHVSEFYRAASLLAAGRDEDAASRFETMLSEIPEQSSGALAARARVALALALARLGRSGEAERQARDALQTLNRLDQAGRGSYGQAALHLSEILEIRGQREEAARWRNEGLLLLDRIYGREHPRMRRWREEYAP